MLSALISIVFLYPIIEVIEDWRRRNSSRRNLAEMRKHVALGHRWDVTRGQWVL